MSLTSKSKLEEYQTQRTLDDEVGGKLCERDVSVAVEVELVFDGLPNRDKRASDRSILLEYI